MSATDDDESKVREQDRRLAIMLADAEAACGPVAWPRVEAFITGMVDLYGAALERMLVAARASARDSNELERRLATDEVVASLLALHDLASQRAPDPIPGQSGLISADRLARGRER
jgi:hypothetical protein